MLLSLLLNISNLLCQLLESIFVGRVLKLELCSGPAISQLPFRVIFAVQKRKQKVVSIYLVVSSG